MIVVFIFVSKICVISGGGSLGAYGGGVLQGLNNEGIISYSHVYGSSTGSLLAPLVALGKYEKLKKAYTSVRDEDIFSHSPFKSNGRVSFYNILKRLICKKPSLGESGNLLANIRKFYTYDDHIELTKSGVIVGVVVYNISLQKPEYKFNYEYNHEDFTKWMWVSANVPIVMSLYTDKDTGYQYVDGSVGDHIPLANIIHDSNISDIDIVINRSKSHIDPLPKVKTVPQMTERLLSSMLREISVSDLKMIAHNPNYNLRAFYIPSMLEYENELEFDIEKMRTWWDMGKVYGEAFCNIKSTEIP